MLLNSHKTTVGSKLTKVNVAAEKIQSAILVAVVS